MKKHLMTAFVVVIITLAVVSVWSGRTWVHKTGIATSCPEKPADEQPLVVVTEKTDEQPLVVRAVVANIGYKPRSTSTSTSIPSQSPSRP